MTTSIRTSLRRLATRILAPYRVRVYGGYNLATHYAWSTQDALEWAACYRDAVVHITTRHGHLVAHIDSQRF